jgi:hypothetical protein
MSLNLAGRSFNRVGVSFSLVGVSFTLVGMRFDLVGMRFDLGRISFNLVILLFTPTARVIFTPAATHAVTILNAPGPVQTIGNPVGTPGIGNISEGYLVYRKERPFLLDSRGYSSLT